jgi:hypothetical protein
MRYAYFPAAHRLAIAREGRVTVYDSADHVITGFAQQQGGDATLTFSGQRGMVRLAELQVVATDNGTISSPSTAHPLEGAAAEGEAASIPPRRESSHEDLLATIERLSELRQKGVLSVEEFESKKAELLARL